MNRLTATLSYAAILTAIVLASACIAREANIAYVAELAASPVLAGSAHSIVDGDVRTSVSFEVGTEGDGAFTFTFQQPRTVHGIRFYQPSDIYFTDTWAVEADRNGDGEFETQIVRAENAPVKGWVERMWEPVVVSALRWRSVSGVSKGRRAHPTMAEIQILGQFRRADMEKASDRGIVLDQLPAVREIDRVTPLSANGKALAVLGAEDPRYATANQRLMEALAEMGIDTEKVRDVEEADPANRNVVCLGNMLNNELIERLYWNRYTFADAVVPGPGNYLIHTVYDPYPYNGQHNVIIIGCSDVEGAIAGVDRFGKLVDDRSFPYTVEFGPEPALTPEEASTITAEEPDPTLLELTENANLYLQTGEENYARQAIAAIDIVNELYAPGGERHEDTDAPGSREMPWPEETSSWEILCAWDAFEECPLLTDQQRLEFSNSLLQFTRDLTHHCSGWGAIGTRKALVSWNHTTFPLLGIHFGARYFDRHYGLADMPGMLEKAETVFTAQCRSWKPEEDADGYLTLTTRHSQIYALAENRMHYFKSSNMKAYADYVVGICDNRGWSSGFGDSGLSSGPGRPQGVLPLALWWTRDAGYKWLMHHYGSGQWDNPYERGIHPRRPDRFTGVNVFMTDEQVYEYYQTYPSYNEPFEQAEVPLEDSFDKITFRENWDPKGQYLILDGLSRGKHLHYDGNSIIEFVEDGERWLLDHDYLTRNTTEHSMLTIMKNGRCEKLVPVLSGLNDHTDLPGFGSTDTYTPDYNSCDWRRQILWRRGEYFLVADTVTPRDGDRYEFDLTYKTIDNAGQQEIVNDYDFIARRGPSATQTQGSVLVDDEAASNGKALVMKSQSARIAFGLDVPAGEYSMEIIGYGVDPSSDSVWGAVDAGEKQAFHLPKSQYGSSASSHDLTTDTPRVTVEGDGHHLVLITLRENPPIHIDRFIFTDADGDSYVFDASDLPEPPEMSEQLARNLLIKPADPLTAWVTNHVREGISAPVSILHQRRGGSFDKGEKVRVASLLYTDLPDARRNLKPVRLADNLIAIRGTDPAVALVGPVESHGISAQLDAGLITPDSCMFSGLSSLTVGDMTISATTPIDLQIDWDEGRATVRASNKTQLRIQSGSRDTSHQIGKARTDIAIQSDEAPGSVGELLTSLTSAPQSRDAGNEAALEATPPAWTAFAGDGKVSAMKTADLKDGLGQRIFVCRGLALECLDLSGDRLWSFPTGGEVRDVCFGDIRDNPGTEIIFGSMDTHIYVLSADGELIDKGEMRGIPYARSFGERPFGVYNVGCWDINDDGQLEIVATMGNFDMQALSSDLDLIWRYNTHALHGSMQLSFEDTDGDQQADTIFVGDKYGSAKGVRPDGMLHFRKYTSIGDVFYAVGDLTGNSEADCVVGSSTGDMVATSVADSAENLWRFDNYGYPVNRLRMDDLNADGKNEVILASGTGYVYVLDAGGDVLWQDRAGLGVNDAVVLQQDGEKQLAYCDHSGLVRIASPSGEPVRDIHTEAPPQLLLQTTDSEGHPVLVVGLLGGKVAAYSL